MSEMKRGSEVANWKQRMKRGLSKPGGYSGAEIFCKRLIDVPDFFDYGNLRRLSGKRIWYVERFFVGIAVNHILLQSYTVDSMSQTDG